VARIDHGRFDPTRSEAATACKRVAAIKEVRMGDNAHPILLMLSGDEIPCSKKYWNSALEKLM